MQVAIFTEAGFGYGFGHLSRCTALKECFEMYGFKTTLYLQNDTNWQSDIVKYLQNVDIVVIDSYHAKIDSYLIAKKLTKYAIWFDDENRLNYPDGLIIDSSKTPILRKEFASTDYKIKTVIKKVFLSLGSLVSEEILNSIIDEVRKKDKEISFVIVSSGQNLSLKDEILNEVNAQMVASKIKECDFAISAGGQTMQELASIGVPCVALMTATNQYKNIQNALKNKNIVASVDINDANFAKKIAKNMALKNINVLESQTKNIALVAIKAVLSQKLKENFEIDEIYFKNFANLAKDEALTILNWRNDAKIRMWSLNSVELAKKDHLNFVKTRKTDNKSAYFVVYKNSVAIGVVNLSSIDYINLCAKVGIYIAPHLFGKGYGKEVVLVLKKLAFLLGFKKLIAEIAQDNLASIKAHANAGYAKEGELKNYFIDGQSLLLFGATNG